MESVNTNFIVEGFNSFVAASGILGVLFNVVVFVVVVLYVIQVVRIYGKFVLAEHVKLTEIIRPFVILMVIVFWKWIYFDMLVSGFDALMGLVVGKLDETGANSDLFGKIKDASLGEEISLIELSIETVIVWVIKALVIGVNVIIDVFVALYVGCNDLILAILAPICIAFAMLDETRDIFSKWLKTFIMFRIYLFMVVIVNQLALGLLAAVTAKGMMGSVGDIAKMGGDAGVAAIGALAPIALLAYIAFKLIFILSSFKMLSNFFGVSDGGLGGASVGLTSSITKGVKLAATKGVAK